MSKPSVRTIAVRVLKRIALVLVGVQVFYLVVANLLLSTGLLARIVSRHPHSLTLEYDHAWTVWFGRVHARHLALRGSAEDLEWAVQADAASLDIRLRDLLKRRVQASQVRGENFSFRLRLRLTPAESERPEVLALPTIEGFADPPLRRIGPPEEGDPDPAHLWTTHLDVVDVGVREIWIEHYRFLGEGRTRGGFRMKPRTVLEVMPSVLDLDSGALTLGEHTVATGTQGHVDCTILPLNPAEKKGLEVFENVVAKVAVGAQVPNLGFLAFYLDPRTGVKVTDGSGRTDGDVTIDHGRVMPGSRVVYETEHVDVTTPRFSVTGEARATIHAPEDPESTALTLTTEVRRASVQRPGTDVAPPRVENLKAELTSPAMNLAHPHARFSATVDMPYGVIPDLRWIDPARLVGHAGHRDQAGHEGHEGRGGKPGVMPAITGGAAYFQAHLAMTPDDRVSGHVAAHVEKAVLQWKDVTVRGDVVSTVNVDVGDLRAKTLLLEKSHVHLANTTIERKGDSRPWWATVDVREAEISPRRIGASIEARCKDGQPAVELLEAGKVLPEWAGGLLHTESLTLSAKLEHKGKHLDFTLLRARGGSLDVRGRLKRPDHSRPEGAFLIKAGPLAVGIAIDERHTHVVPFESEAWIDRRIASLGR